jgi:hypothetical protein
MKKLFIFLLFVHLLIQLSHAQLAVGTVRKSVITDTNGNVINNPLIFSNQVSVLVNATSQFQVVNFGQFTNTVTATTNIYPLAVSKGGTSTTTTQLPGSWTNTVNFTIGGTSSANAYRVHGTLGFSGSVTNLGPSLGSSNVVVFSDGIVTNKFTIP